jgi:hypothetical protein
LERAVAQGFDKPGAKTKKQNEKCKAHVQLGSANMSGAIPKTEESVGRKKEMSFHSSEVEGRQNLTKSKDISGIAKERNYEKETFT